MAESRISGLHRLGVSERIARLHELGWLNSADAELLRQGRHTLLTATADKMVEDAIGVFGLPLAVAPNFTVNGRDYLVPMVIEEPSVVAAVSKAALEARETGGFESRRDESLLIGQVHISNVKDVGVAIERVIAAGEDIARECDATQPRLAERGGGVRGVEARPLDAVNTVAVHLLVDTCDAMGANLVNSMCEAVAPMLASICDGDVSLRILSNLADRSLVRARVRYTPSDEVRDGIVRASEIAAADPYRAATHNKGIMNGVDAVAIATGNDWRAIEAGAHAFAAQSGQYGPLATWSVGDDGALIGEITLPLKVGIVGGSLAANPGAALGLRIAGIESARELAELIGAVGLAQNFAAIRALATSGIQAGHMKLHARSVAASADVPEEQFDDVVADLVAGGDVKTSVATELSRQRESFETTHADGVAAGKVILLGEHAVVYGKYALAVPINEAVAATLVDAGGNVPQIPGIEAAIELIRDRLGVSDAHHSVQIRSRLPIAMGLGASAAFAVAIARAFNNKLGLGLDDDAINEVAYECEKLAHGTPSGIDNTIATFAQPILFRRDKNLHTEIVKGAPPLIVACSGQRGHTREQVAAVRERVERHPDHFAAIFDSMDALSRAGAEALQEQDHATLGDLMNICHGLLNAIGVSTPELDAMVGIARAAGASGAKLTGAGGGGSIVALCPDAAHDVETALRAAGYRTLQVT